MTMLVDKIGVLSRVGSDKLQIKPMRHGQLGHTWRHQYADPTNQADSRDPYVGSAFRLQWFGGVGPSRIARSPPACPAPLAAGAVLIMQR
ncbi:MAG: hypothetical protein R3C56_35585 [Pirellulaceae bacterium]